MQGVEVIPKKRGENPEWRKRTKLNYHSPNSFLFAPKLFHEVKCFGFNPMHKRIRVVENICHMCEHKYAQTHMCELYCDSRTRGQALAAAHKHFMSEIKINWA